MREVSRELKSPKGHPQFLGGPIPGKRVSHPTVSFRKNLVLGFIQSEVRPGWDLSRTHVSLFFVSSFSPVGMF